MASQVTLNHDQLHAQIIENATIAFFRNQAQNAASVHPEDGKAFRTLLGRDKYTDRYYGTVVYTTDDGAWVKQFFRGADARTTSEALEKLFVASPDVVEFVFRGEMETFSVLAGGGRIDPLPVVCSFGGGRIDPLPVVRSFGGGRADLLPVVRNIRGGE